MKKILQLVAFCMVICNLNANDNIKLAKELKEKFPNEDVVLSKSSVTFEFKHLRKKGFVGIESRNEDFLGLKKNMSYEYPIFYNDNISLEDLSADGGYLTNPTNYNADNIFHDDIKYRSAIYRIHNCGDERSLKAKMIFKDLRYMTTVYFNNYYHTLDREIVFKIPKNVKVELIPYNFNGYNIEKNVKHENDLEIIKYNLKEIDKISSDDHKPGNSHLYPHIIIRILSYEFQGETTTLFNTTQDLYDWYAKLVDETENETDAIKPLVEKLLVDKKDDLERISTIYYWIQDNIRYLAFEDGIAGFKPASCQKVFKNRYGDCKGMSNLAKHMLQIAGYDARLAWVGTRKLAYDYSIPSLIVDNHVICAVKINDDFIFLDPTVKYLCTGNVHEGIQGKNVMIENGKSFILKNIPPSSCKDNKLIYNLNLKLNEDYELVGSLAMELTGEAKIAFLNGLTSFDSRDQEHLLKRYLSNFNKLIRVSDVSVPTFEHSNKVTAHADVHILDKTSAFENELYMYPDPFQFYKHFVIDKERKVPFWFNYKREVSLNISLEIPDNLNVISIPKNLSIQKNSYTFKSSINKNNNIVNYTFKTYIIENELSLDKFDEWNSDINELNNFYQQPLILNKK